MVCEEYLRVSIGPFVEDLMISISPKDIEALRKKYNLDKIVQAVQRARVIPVAK